jgi:hypothetical protein
MQQSERGVPPGLNYPVALPAPFLPDGSMLLSHEDSSHPKKLDHLILAAASLERETIDAEEVKMLIEGKELPPMRSNLATPSDTGSGTPQQVLKPESRSGPGFPEGSPSPA